MDIKTAKVDLEVHFNGAQDYFVALWEQLLLVWER